MGVDHFDLFDGHHLRDDVINLSGYYDVFNDGHHVINDGHQLHDVGGFVFFDGSTSVC